MIGLKKSLKSPICKNTNDKVKGTNLKTNPHRPVSRSRGAVFRFYQEPFPSKQSMSSTWSKIDLNSVAKVQRQFGIITNPLKSILIIGNLLGQHFGHPSVRSQSINNASEGSLAISFVASCCIFCLFFLFVFLKATFLLTSTKDCAEN